MISWPFSGPKSLSNLILGPEYVFDLVPGPESVPDIVAELHQQ